MEKIKKLAVVNLFSKDRPVATFFLGIDERK